MTRRIAATARVSAMTVLLAVCAGSCSSSPATSTGPLVAGRCNSQDVNLARVIPGWKHLAAATAASGTVSADMESTTAIFEDVASFTAEWDSQSRFASSGDEADARVLDAALTHLSASLGKAPSGAAPSSLRADIKAAEAAAAPFAVCG